MQHTDQETLAMIALGEVPATSASDHFRACPACAADLEGLRRVVAAARTSTRADAPLQVLPDDVWDGIRGELGLGSSSRPSPADSSPGEAPTAVSVTADTPPVRTALGNGATRQAEGSDDDRTATPLVGRSSSRRPTRRSFAITACAALLGAAAGSGITWWAVQHGGSADGLAGPRTPLQPLTPAALGSARLGDSRGERRIDIRVQGLPKTSGYFEVWLMDRSHTKLISMGVLGPDGHAVLPVPETVDLNEYAVVDVSVQAYNGNPAHSGNSIVRGPFAAG